MFKGARWLSGSAGPLLDLKQKQMAVDEQAVILATLAESVARAGCRLLEVGSWCGDSTMVLGAVAKRHDGHLFCIDWWKGNIGTDLERIAEQRDVFSVFWQRVRESGLEDVVIPMRGKSEDIGGILAPGRFDLIYIDGDHRHESACRDVAGFSPMVRDGGVLCGDDCEGRLADFDPEFLEAGKDRDCVESVHCGVVLAVGQAFHDYSIDYNIWSVQRTGPGWRPLDIEFPGVRRKRQFSPPVIESHAVYNLVRYGRLVYAIPHALGPVDVTEEETRRRPEIVSAASVAALRKKLDKAIAESRDAARAQGGAAPPPGQAGGPAALPIKLGAFLGFNIVRYQGVIYALHRGLGPLDLGRQRVTPETRGVLVAGFVGELLLPIVRFRAGSVRRRVLGIWRQWKASTIRQWLPAGRQANRGRGAFQHEDSTGAVKGPEGVQRRRLRRAVHGDPEGDR